MGCRHAVAVLLLMSRLSAERVGTPPHGKGHMVLQVNLKLDSSPGRATSVYSPSEELTAADSLSEQATRNENNPGDFRMSASHWLLIFFAIALMMAVMACCHCMKSLPCLRSIPISAGVAFVLSWTGFAMSTAARSKVEGAMDELGVEGVEALLNLLAMSFTIMIFVNIAALILGFIGAGCFREFFFGQRATGFPCLLRTGQCMLGPLALMCVRIFLWVTFALQLCLSYAFLLVGIIMVVVAGICHGGASAVGHAEQLLGDMHGSTLHLQGACNSIMVIGKAGLLLFAGCGITVFSQAGMLSALAKEQAQIEDEMKKKAPSDVDDCSPAVNDSQT